MRDELKSGWFTKEMEKASLQKTILDVFWTLNNEQLKELVLTINEIAKKKS